MVVHCPVDQCNQKRDIKSKHSANNSRFALVRVDSVFDLVLQTVGEGRTASVIRGSSYSSL